MERSCECVREAEPDRTKPAPRSPYPIRQRSTRTLVINCSESYRFIQEHLSLTLTLLVTKKKHVLRSKLIIKVIVLHGPNKKQALSRETGNGFAYTRLHDNMRSSKMATVLLPVSVKWQHRAGNARSHYRRCYIRDICMLRNVREGRCSLKTGYVSLKRIKKGSCFP